MVRQRTPHAEPLDLSDVAVDDEFWNHYVERVRERMLEYQYEQLEDSGCLDNFRIAADDADGEFEGFWFADTDAYKWIEAASYVLTTADDPDLEDRVDEVISLIEAAQAEDGYLNTWIAIEYPGKRWTNLSIGHELYCAGHLIEAAVAHHRATGEDSLLEVARAFADLIDEVFGPDGRQGVPGHEEIELALVKLYRVTGEDRYLDLASFFVEGRGEALEYEFEDTEDRAGSEEMWSAIESALFDDEAYDGTYAQDHAPIREQETVEGHSVRAMYYFAAAADLVLETGDSELYEQLQDLWRNMTERRMYVTGGIGSTHHGERFTEDYHLPNRTSYAETCAAVGSVFWNHRMFQLSGDVQYPELVERTLYNGFLAGISRDATEFFYANPLEVGPDGHALADENPDRFSNQRQGWFDCACCPPNAARLIASLGRYIYARATDEPAVYVNQFVGSEAALTVDDADVRLRQESALPWSGDVTLTVDAAEPTDFALRVRVPEWCTDVTATVAGESRSVDPEEGYIEVAREWDEAVELTVTFGMAPEQLVAHPAVDAASGNVALRRGPVVYCLEGVDHDRPLAQYAVPEDAAIEASHRSDLLGGVTVLEGEARVPDRGEWSDVLYRRAAETERLDTSFTAVPYYAWANRDPGEMRVWLETE